MLHILLQRTRTWRVRLESKKMDNTDLEMSKLDRIKQTKHKRVVEGKTKDERDIEGKIKDERVINGKAKRCCVSAVSKRRFEWKKAVREGQWSTACICEECEE